MLGLMELFHLRKILSWIVECSSRLILVISLAADPETDCARITSAIRLRIQSITERMEFKQISLFEEDSSVGCQNIASSLRLCLH